MKKSENDEKPKWQIQFDLQQNLTDDFYKNEWVSWKITQNMNQIIDHINGNSNFAFKSEIGNDEKEETKNNTEK